METIITSEGDMVDQLAYRHYGTHEGTTAAIVEIKLPVIERPVPEITVKLYD
jgi:phage tail protein X